MKKAEDARQIMYKYWNDKRDCFVTEGFKQRVDERITAAAQLGCGHCYFEELTLCEAQYLRSLGYHVKRHMVSGWIVSWIDLKEWTKIAEEYD